MTENGNVESVTATNALGENESREGNQDEVESSITFFPPAYIQRYNAVVNVLEGPRYKSKIKKVVDFGCSELNFFVHLKNTLQIEEILCVDIDRNTLENYKQRVEPINADYLHPKTVPLKVQIYEGSVTQNDTILKDVDAVICIELIEHLHENEVKNLPENIFGYIQPKVAVITTPNADFNVLFPNFQGFRHYDHKFEWTREEFQDWASSVISKFPDYEVTFEGIGKGPDGSEELGCCSQMAVFHRQSEDRVLLDGVNGLFALVAEIKYPMRIDNRSDEEKISDDVLYHTRNFFYDNNGDVEFVPLAKILEALESLSISTENLREILTSRGYVIEEREEGSVVLQEEPPDSSPFSDDDFYPNLQDIGVDSDFEEDWM